MAIDETLNDSITIPLDSLQTIGRGNKVRRAGLNGVLKNGLNLRGINRANVDTDSSANDHVCLNNIPIALEVEILE